MFDPATHDDSRTVPEGVVSALRTISMAKGDKRLPVFQNFAPQVYRAVLAKQLEIADATDKLRDCAIGNGLLDEIGEDALTAEMAAAVRKAAINGHASSVAEPAGLIVHRASEIAPEAIQWVWRGRVALGKHTCFAGEPGTGKSQLSIFVAAMVTTGGEWPCGEGHAPVGSVIVLSAEDGEADTVVPRLMAAGADCSRVHIVTAVRPEAGKGRRAFNLQHDLELLERKITEIGDVVLVIIDPVSSYLGKTDSHKNSEVRTVLEPLSEMAARLRVAVVSITHFSKGGPSSSGKALHRFIGSIAFVGAPRAAFAVVEDPDNLDRRLLLHAKNNLARAPQGLAFRLAQTAVGEANDIIASYLVWDKEPVTMTADAALQSCEVSDRGGARAEAEDFLRDRLANGPVLVEEIEDHASVLGITKATLKRARRSLGVLAKKAGMQGPWELSLAPEGAHEEAQNTEDAQLLH